jgi:hypothetical protein
MFLGHSSCNGLKKWSITVWQLPQGVSDTFWSFAGGGYGDPPANYEEENGSHLQMADLEAVLPEGCQ